jgi:hypothetical protein
MRDRRQLPHPHCLRRGVWTKRARAQASSPSLAARIATLTAPRPAPPLPSSSPLVCIALHCNFALIVCRPLLCPPHFQHLRLLTSTRDNNHTKVIAMHRWHASTHAHHAPVARMTLWPDPIDPIDPIDPARSQEPSRSCHQSKHHSSSFITHDTSTQASSVDEMHVHQR